MDAVVPGSAVLRYNLAHSGEVKLVWLKVLPLRALQCSLLPDIYVYRH